MLHENPKELKALKPMEESEFQLVQFELLQRGQNWNEAEARAKMVNQPMGSNFDGVCS